MEAYDAPVEEPPSGLEARKFPLRDVCSATSVLNVTGNIALMREVGRNNGFPCQRNLKPCLSSFYRAYQPSLLYPLPCTQFRFNLPAVTARPAMGTAKEIHRRLHLHQSPRVPFQHLHGAHTRRFAVKTFRQSSAKTGRMVNGLGPFFPTVIRCRLGTYIFGNGFDRE